MGERLLINRDFGLLWMASFVSRTGDLCYALALAWLVLERTRSPAVMGLFLVAAYLPGFLISPWAGMVIDRSRPRRVLVAADLLRAAVVALAALPVALGRSPLGPILAAAVLLSLASAFFEPTARLVVPRLVPGGRLLAANARMQLIAGVTSVAGPLLGGILLGSTGYTGAFLVNAGSFVVSAALLLALRIPAGAAPAGPEEAGLRGGFRHLAGHPGLLAVLGVIFGVHLCYGSLAVLLPFLAATLAGSGVLNLGLLEAALGAGMLASSVALGWGRAEGGAQALVRAILGLGLGLLLLGAGRALGIGNPALYLGALAVVGLGTATASVIWTTILQRTVPERMAGRVFALAAAAGNIALPLAYGTFGLLLGAVRLTAVLLGCGAATVAAGCLAGRIKEPPAPDPRFGRPGS